MKIINFNGNTLELYSDIKDLPIKNYRAFQKYILIDIGIGTTIDDVSKHFEKLHFFLSNNKVDYAIKEAENLHFAFYEMINEIDYQCYSFCCLINKLNGQKIENLSEEYLDSKINELNELGLTQLMVDDYIDQIKKKLIAN